MSLEYKARSLQPRRIRIAGWQPEFRPSTPRVTNPEALRDEIYQPRGIERRNSGYQPAITAQCPAEYLRAQTIRNLSVGTVIQEDGVKDLI